MDRLLKSLLVAGACACGLSACATYDYGYPGYSYSEPYYGYGYNYGYAPYGYNYYGYPSYYGYAPDYYVGPSVGLGFAFRDGDHHHDNDWHRGDNRFRGDRHGAAQANRAGRDAAHLSGAYTNGATANDRNRQAARASMRAAPANARNARPNESGATRMAPVRPDRDRVASGRQRFEMRAEQ